MQKIIIAAIVLVLIAGAFYVFNRNDETDTGDSLVATTTAERDVALTTFSDSTLEVAFEYPTGPDGYVLDDLSAYAGGDLSGLEVVKVLRIINTKEKTELENSEGGREGPPTMQVMVFRNTENQSASQWVDAHPTFSGIEMARGPVDRDVVVGGANAVRYTTDGLYLTDNVVVASGDFMYHFAGSYLDVDSAIKQDFNALIDSVRFIPATTAAPAPAGRIDVRVACESALAYMLFESGEQADRFMAECVAGEHPDVIDRYLSEQGVDPAVI